jgi:hypothetical protein
LVVFCILPFFFGFNSDVLKHVHGIFGRLLFMFVVIHIIYKFKSFFNLLKKSK